MAVKKGTYLLATGFDDQGMEESAIYCEFFQLKGGEDVRRAKIYEVGKEDSAQLCLIALRDIELRPLTDQSFYDFLKERMNKNGNRRDEHISENQAGRGGDSDQAAQK